MKIIAALALALTASAAEKTLRHAAFAVPVPAGWIAEQEEDGWTLIGPRDRKVAAQISLRYIPPGHPSYADADAYLARLTKKPAFEVPGWKTGPVQDAVVAGRKAKKIENDSSEFVPPRRRDTKEVPMREEHFVVPASKGFFVLLYYAPRSISVKNRPAFQKVLDGFKPKL